MSALPDDATIAAAVRAELPAARGAWLFGSAAHDSAVPDMAIVAAIDRELDLLPRVAGLPVQRHLP